MEKVLAARDGATVGFFRRDTKKSHTVCLCARPDKGKHVHQEGCVPISCDAPIGRALLGKKPGDKVSVNLPNGSIAVIEVLSVKFDTPAIKAA